MENLTPNLRPAIGLPLRYFAAGIASMVVALAAVTAEPAYAFGAFLRNPPLIALLHLVTLGWIGMVMQGAVYQLVPVLLHAPLRSERWGRVAFYPYVVGVVLLVGGFAFWEPRLMVGGAALILVGLGLFLANCVLSVRRAKPQGFFVRGFGTSWLFLSLLVAWGVALAANARWDFLGGTFPRGIAGHASWGGVGWFHLLSVTVAYRLIPMFAPSAKEEGRFREVVHVLLTAGTVFLGVGGTWGWRAVVTAGWVAAAAGTILFATDVVRIARARARRTWEPPLLGSLLASWIAVAAVMLGGCALLAEGLGAIESARFVSAAGYLALFGWFGLLILANLSKITTFLVGIGLVPHRRHGRVPREDELYPPAPARPLLVAYAVGVAVAAAGGLVGFLGVSRLGAGIAAVAAYGEVALLVRAWSRARAWLTLQEAGE